MSRILIIEDEVAIADLEKDYLELSGFEVVTEHTGDEGLERALTEEFDLVVLDLMLPGMDGFEVCKKIREKNSTPIIMLTARDGEVDKVLGLELGADDYCTKPFSVRELMARVKAVAMRANPELTENNEKYIFGDLVIDVPSHSIKIKGELINVTPKEFDLLVCLVQNKGVALSRERILLKVWNYDYFGEGRTVDTHIKMLRSHLKEYRDCIETVWGVGYKFEIINE